MANTGSQADAIRDLLIERLLAYDPSADVSSGSRLDSEVVQPIFRALGIDPFTTDAATFLRARIRQEYPNVAAGEADALTALLLRPLQLLQEPLRREIQTVRRGQSVRNANEMRTEDAEALAANVFVSRRVGNRASTRVRVYYASPSFVVANSTTTFTTTGGLRFFPAYTQLFSAEVMLLQQEGNDFYVDVVVRAEEAGDEYNVSAGEINSVRGLGAAIRVSNLADVADGLPEETPTEVLARAETSLVERSLTVRRGILARLLETFPSTRSAEVVGFGDPEMQRDLLTGGGQGSVYASGVCFIVGELVLMFSTYEDTGHDGRREVSVGHEIDFNFWPFLYDLPAEEQHERFRIEEVLLNSKELITENLPSILLLRISGVPTPAGPLTNVMPGILAGVFCVVRGPGVVEVSDIPGGILRPDTARGTVVVEDGQIHLGGHYDVWIRPAVDTLAATLPGTMRSSSFVVEGEDLVTGGAEPAGQNRVHRAYSLTYTPSTGTLAQGSTITGGTSGASGRILVKTATTLTLVGLVGAFEVGETISSSGATAVVTGVSSTPWTGVTEGMCLSILQGGDAGSYRVIGVDGVFLYLDRALTGTDNQVHFRVVTEVVIDLMAPKLALFPFGSSVADDLRSVVGSTRVRVGADLQHYGAQVGDTLEILEGVDKGSYIIEGFDATLGGTAPLLSEAMQATNSGIEYRVYRAGGGVQPPLVRLTPGGVHLLALDGQDTNIVVPPATPVDARPRGDFSGAEFLTEGLNGFVMPDPGESWRPTGDLACDPNDYPDADTCISDDCLPCDGYLVCMTLMDDGSFYMNSQLPPAVQSFLTETKDWLLAVIDSFILGDDIRDFVVNLQPVILGAPPAGVIKLQFEVCLPLEMFDGCNNTFVALPEFDWTELFAEADSFAEVLDAYNQGTITTTPPALAQAAAGDSLTIGTGANAGSYVIHKVYEYALCTASAIVSGDASIDRCYKVVAVVIDGQFPVLPLGDLPAFFAAGGVPDAANLPSPPAFPGTSYDGDGNSQSPWEWVELFLTWLFQWLVSLGFNLPDSVTLNAAPVVQAVWEMLFSHYSVGKTTCTQVVRTYFVEPTSFTASGLLPCTPYTHTTRVDTVPEVATDPAAPVPVVPAGSLLRLSVQWFGGELSVNEAIDNSLEGPVATWEDVAAFLQATVDPDGERVLFSGTANANGVLTVTSVAGGVDSSVYLYVDDPTDVFALLGFASPGNTATGTSAPGATTAYSADAPPPTLYLATVGADALSFVVSGDEEPAQVFPGQTTEGAVPVYELPRDILIPSSYSGMLTADVLFTDTGYAAPMLAGIRAGTDLLHVYEQRSFLDTTVPEEEAHVLLDRVIAVTTVSGSPILRLPPMANPEFTFLAPQDPTEGAVDVGDILFIEEGEDARGYVVTARSANELTISGTMTETTEQVYRVGNDGDIALNTAVLESVSANFTSADVGRYLTIWANDRSGYDGSYEITAVTDLGAGVTSATLNTSAFDFTMQDIHWAVVRAPDSTESSAIDGRTALVGVRPIRVYRKDPFIGRISQVSDSLIREEAVVSIELPAVDSPPKRRTKQPYQVVRPGVQHTSSTAMSEQRERGLFYADVLVKSSGHTAEHNISKDVRLTPVFGTYKSDGYRMEVADSRYTFSTLEQTNLVLTMDFLPAGEVDTGDNRILLEGRALSVAYDTAPLVDQIQQFMLSEADRQVCANPLVRHYIPSYVYLDATYLEGATPDVVATAIQDRINALGSTDPLDVSDIEGAFHENSVLRYDHPLEVVILTHDLDRQLIASRTTNRIDEDQVEFNGSNRTTYFIPGPDRSSVAAEEDIPVGERTYLVRSTRTSSLR